MSVPRPFGDTALDRVAGALASEAARTELYRYATGVADAMPPDASSWYVVGAVVQVNAITRNELTTLAAESKKGGIILAGLNKLVTWLPGFGRSALWGGGIASVVIGGLLIWVGFSAYGGGWKAGNTAAVTPAADQVCTSLVNVRHQLALANNHAAVDEMQRQIVGRGCKFSPVETPKPAKPGA